MQAIVLLVLATVVAVLVFVVFRLANKEKPADAEDAAVRQRLIEKERELAVLNERLTNKENDLGEAEERIKTLSGERDKLGEDLGQIKQDFAALSSKTAGEEEAKRMLKAQFAEAAVDALRANGETFLGLAEGKLRAIQKESSGELNTKKAEIDGLINPMAKTLEKLDESVRSLSQSEASLLNETKQLASALKETKKRGNWGELQLKRIAELSGMEERCDFTLQTSVLTDERRRLYPDMTVNLPNNRVIVVDSKVSMVAYGESANATEPAIQQQKLAEHAKAVRQRVDELAGKEYQSHVEGSADFVICFLPLEAYFSAAIAADPELLEYAARKSVILASPTTFLTILRAVALGWKEAKIAQEAKQIFNLATDLYERFRRSTEYVEAVGGGLNTAIKQYNAFIGSIEARVFPQARKLQRMSGIEKELIELESIEVGPRSLVANDWLLDHDVLPALAAEQETPDSE